MGAPGKRLRLARLCRRSGDREAAAKRERPSSGAARLAVLHWTHHPLPGFRPWLQSSINLVATATNIQPLSALLFPNTPHTPCSPRTPPPLSRPSPGTGKGNYCFSKQNAVYAEQVEINLCQLLQGVARGLWLAMHQASRGEGERGDFLPLWVLALLVEPGGSLLSWSPASATSSGSAIHQHLIAFLSPSFLISLYLRLHLHPHPSPAPHTPSAFCLTLAGTPAPQTPQGPWVASTKPPLPRPSTHPD